MRFALDAEQRQFAASIDAALADADLPAAVRAWNKGDAGAARAVWTRLADLGITALGVAEEFGGVGAHPVDLVVAVERLGRWCVPGPVVESIAVAPLLLAGDDRSAALAAGDLITTVAMPPMVPLALDAEFAGLTLLAGDGVVAAAAPSAGHPSVDPARQLFQVRAVGDQWRADTDRAFDFGALATTAQLLGAGQAMLEMSVDHAKQRTQFGRPIGGYQAIKHKLADVH
ncbi:MAG: acyl-CoA dehydrogenase, partial [Mycobacterium sp.]|nr:acyl-CoA dehydrogenase [Mycobacterium sp.]